MSDRPTVEFFRACGPGFPFNRSSGRRSSHHRPQSRWRPSATLTSLILRALRCRSAAIAEDPATAYDSYG